MLELGYKEFFNIQSEFKQVPFSQSAGWFRYLKAKGEDLVFYVNNLEQPKVGFMGRVKLVPLIGKVLLVEGELMHDDITNQLLTDFYKEVTQLPYEGIEVDSNGWYISEFEIGIRRAGFIRPLGFFNCPLTMLIDLNTPLKLNKNWKYNFRKALKHKLVFEEVTDPTLEQAIEFSEMYKSMSIRKGLNYGLKPEAVLELVKNKNMRFFFVRNGDQFGVSSGIVYINGETSYYIFAANSNEAIKNGASRLIIKSVLEKLASEGIASCDFGRIPPSVTTTDNIYIFKSGIDGKNIQYNGEWVHYSSRVKEYMMHFAKIFFLKTQRY